MRQQTLVIFKPDALFKSIVGDALTPLSRLRLKIVGAKVVRITKKLAKQHYYHLRHKEFFNNLVEYFCGKIFGEEYRRVLALVYEGDNAIKKVKKVVGPTNPKEAAKYTIRGKFGTVDPKREIMLNIIHCSDSEEEAEREIKLWFQPDELVKRIYPTKKIKVKNITKTVWK